jgi:isobutyryl-CoA mutase
MISSCLTWHEDLLFPYGVACIVNPEDGQRLHLSRMILSMIDQCDVDMSTYAPTSLGAITQGGAIAANQQPLAQLTPGPNNGNANASLTTELHLATDTIHILVLGITGTERTGKSLLTDEPIRHLCLEHGDALKIAVICIDPLRRKFAETRFDGRISTTEINVWNGPSGLQSRMFIRSLSIRKSGNEIAQALADVNTACKVGGYYLVTVENSGVCQGDAGS